MNQRRHRLAVSGLLLIAAGWGASFVVVKSAVEQLDVATFLTIRFAIAAVLFIFFVDLRSLRSRRTLLRGAVLGLVVAGAYWLQTEGLRFTTPSKSAFLTSLSVVLVPALETLRLGRLPSRRIAMAAIVAFAGTFVMVEGWRERLSAGDLLTVACAFAFAAYLILASRFSGQDATTPLAFLQIAVVALVAAPFADWSVVPSLKAATWAAIIGTGLFNTTISFFILMWSQRFVTASESSLLLSIEPVVAAIVSIAVGGEPHRWPVVAGGTIIVGAIFLAERRAPAPVDR